MLDLYCVQGIEPPAEQDNSGSTTSAEGDSSNNSDQSGDSEEDFELEIIDWTLPLFGNGLSISKPQGAADENETAGIDNLDEFAAIIMLITNLILAAGPTVAWLLYIKPTYQAYSYNNMLWYGWQITWIGNIAIYAVPAIFGYFTWTWNAFVVAGYIAWVQYLVMYFGTGLQVVNLIIMLLGALFFQTSDPTTSVELKKSALIAFGIEMGFTLISYIVNWVLSKNFLRYYLVDEILAGVASLGNTDPVFLNAVEAEEVGEFNEF